MKTIEEMIQDAIKKHPEGYTQRADFVPHRWVIKLAADAMMEGLAIGRSQAQAEHHAIQDAQAEEHSMMNTSVIRANMAALAEAVMNNKYTAGLKACRFHINLEAQRTIWDRVELTTSRNADETEVIFTVERK